MSGELQPIINIEASLMNVQRGDVMIIRFPEEQDMTPQKIEATSKKIRHMLLMNDIDIPVLIFPYKWDVLMVEKGDIKKFQIDIEEIVEEDREDE